MHYYHLIRDQKSVYIKTSLEDNKLKNLIKEFEIQWNAYDIKDILYIILEAGHVVEIIEPLMIDY